MAEAVEYLGTKSKFWYREGERQILFKAEERGTGEDWAEKVACELCALLGLPYEREDMAADLDLRRPAAKSARCLAAARIGKELFAFRLLRMVV